MNHVDYSTQGQTLWCEVHRIRRFTAGNREYLWNIALQAAMMFCRSEPQLRRIMLSYDPRWTIRLWWSRETRQKIDTFNRAISPVRSKKLYCERFNHYENRDQITKELGLTRDQALQHQLQYTVPRTWASSVILRNKKDYRPRDWTQFQVAGTRRNAEQALERAQRATDLYTDGMNVHQIARKMLLSPRTIYRYLARELKPSNVFNSVREILNSVTGVSLSNLSEANTVEIESAFQWPVTAGMKYRVLHYVRRIIHRKRIDRPPEKRHNADSTHQKEINRD